MSNPLEYAKQIAYSTEETLMFTYNTAKAFKHHPGVYVETGCAAGAQVIAMAVGAPNKNIWAFDSFAGIPLPSNRDDQIPGIKLLTEQEQSLLPNPGKQTLETSGATVVPISVFWEHINNALGENHRVRAIEGWFEETVPERANLFDQIAILRLDGDLYNSTWVCLQHLFPKVIQGGAVLIDDWELPGCRAACDEYFALIGYEPDYKFISNIAFFYK